MHRLRFDRSFSLRSISYICQVVVSEIGPREAEKLSPDLRPLMPPVLNVTFSPHLSPSPERNSSRLEESQPRGISPIIRRVLPIHPCPMSWPRFVGCFYAFFFHVGPQMALCPLSAHVPFDFSISHVAGRSESVRNHKWCRHLPVILWFFLGKRPYCSPPEQQHKACHAARKKRLLLGIKARIC